jgi:L-lactate utilization protein LutC
MSANDRISLFLENAAKVSAGTHRVGNKDKLRDKVAELVARGVPVFSPRTTELEKVAAAVFDKLAPDYLSADASVEEVTAAIAETGSLVCASSNGKAVQSSLLPSHHVAIVPQEKLFATLDDFFAEYGASPPTNMTLITGPSRTADIELNLVIGVHGPEKLDIIVV